MTDSHTCTQTFIPPLLLSWGVVKLQVDLAVLSSLCSVLAVRCGLVGLVVDLSAECMSELFCGTAAFLAKIVTISEVVAQVRIITVDSKNKIKYCVFL